MKRKVRLFLILIILSLGVYSCYPLNQSGNGDQGNRGRGERRHRHQQEYRDQGDRNYNSQRQQ
jgi:hypothetical protein